MDYAALKTYIEADQTFDAWVLGGNDQQIADEINARTVDKVGGVSRAKFAMWCGVTGLRAAIADHAANPQSPLRSVALTIQDLLLGGVASELDMADATNQAMLGAWVHAGALTQTQADDLTAMATTQVPVFGQHISNLDVAKAFGRTGLEGF